MAMPIATQMLRRTGSMPAELLLLVLVLLAALNDAAATENRPIDQYLYSGYFFPKSIVWQGIRTPPGTLWIGFVCFAASAWWALVLVFQSHKPQTLSGSEAVAGHTLEDKLMPAYLALQEAYLLSAVGGSLLYVSLGVTQLSDAMEAYFVGLCSVQLILDANRGVHSKSQGDASSVKGCCSCSKDHLISCKNLVNVSAIFVPTVLGIALLDSYRPLNKLNGLYTIVGTVILTVMLLVTPYVKSRGLRITVRMVGSLGHLTFPVLALILAYRVEGTQRSPMIAYLVTAGVLSLLISIIESPPAPPSTVV